MLSDLGVYGMTSHLQLVIERRGQLTVVLAFVLGGALLASAVQEYRYFTGSTLAFILALSAGILAFGSP
ncbi:MAG: hypothetical protein ACR2JB_28825 [Bryobacteraceae bacterium]